MPLWKVALLSFTALITMVNPLAVVPSFIALTDGASRAARASVAFVAGLSCMIVLAVFLLAGNYLFDFFGITVPAFQIMGGILFLTNALRTLVTDDRRAYNVGGEKRMEDHDVEKAEIDPTSIAIVPLAVPMLSGPGAITSVMVLVNLYPHIEQKMAVLVAIAAVAKIMALNPGRHRHPVHHQRHHARGRGNHEIELATAARPATAIRRGVRADGWRRAAGPEQARDTFG